MFITKGIKNRKSICYGYWIQMPNKIKKVSMMVGEEGGINMHVKFDDQPKEDQEASYLLRPQPAIKDQIVNLSNNMWSYVTRKIKGDLHVKNEVIKTYRKGFIYFIIINLRWLQPGVWNRLWYCEGRCCCKQLRSLHECSFLK